MKTPDIQRQFDALSPRAKRRVVALIELLSAPGDRNAASEVVLATLEEEPFVGIWKDREDLADGTAWVRRLRNEEWIRRAGAAAENV